MSYKKIKGEYSYIMNNLYKSAGSMFAFSNEKNKMDNAVSGNRAVSFEEFAVINKDRMNAGVSNMTSVRPLEFYD